MPEPGAEAPAPPSAGVLLRNEWFKAHRRPASRVTFGVFLLIAGLGFGSNYVGARGDPDRSWALPGAWPQILGEPVEIASFFVAILLILLIASEFSWRTARQNVIDGLSKERWFWGKALLLPVVSLAFLGAIVLLGGGLALAGTDPAALDASVAGPRQAAALGGGLVRLLGYGSLALAAAMAIRSTGAAMGVWFFYVALGERLLTLGLVRLELVEWLRYLPVNALNAVSNYRQWDRGGLEDAVGDLPGPVPGLWETEALLLVTAGWIAFFLVGSFLWFRRRDL